MSQKKSDQTTVTKPSFWVRVDTKLPWLKVVLLTAVALATAVGTEELIRHNLHQQAAAPTEVASPEIETGGMATIPKPSEESIAESQGEATPPAQELDTSPKLIALTFDDGPSATQTPRLLEILREKQVKVTFFVIGTMAERSPDLVRQEVAEGHEVGSHSYTHANFNRTSPEAVKWEFSAMNQLFRQIIEVEPTLMRPPYGNITSVVRSVATQPLILWTVDTEDWRSRDAGSVRGRAVRDAFDGAVILFHDVYASTVDAVAGVIDDLRARGYEFLTVSELAAVRGVELQNGWSYGSFRPAK